jgi:hypothetical protein
MSDERSWVAYEILSYLAEHPEAQDTLEGIVQWWLLEQEIKHWTEEVKAALADLVVEGLVIEDKGVDGRAHYHLNQRLAEEVSLLLKKKSTQEGDEPNP